MFLVCQCIRNSKSIRRGACLEAKPKVELMLGHNRQISRSVSSFLVQISLAEKQFAGSHPEIICSRLCCNSSTNRNLVDVFVFVRCRELIALTVWSIDSGGNRTPCQSEMDWHCGHTALPNSACWPQILLSRTGVLLSLYNSHWGFRNELVKGALVPEL